METLKTADDVLGFFEEVIKNNTDVMIKSVFSISERLCSEKNLITFDRIFILFENNTCIVLKCWIPGVLSGEVKPATEIDDGLCLVLEDEIGRQADDSFGTIEDISVNLVISKEMKEGQYNEIYLETASGKTIAICLDAELYENGIIVQIQ
ncbi:MAG: hypothetical protein IJZ51_00070 [Ruminiclostridium sp.]|nr:hypothetical protein [Ruminiclostridium sp.]